MPDSAEDPLPQENRPQADDEANAEEPPDKSEPEDPQDQSKSMPQFRVPAWFLRHNVLDYSRPRGKDFAETVLNFDDKTDGHSDPEKQQTDGAPKKPDCLEECDVGTEPKQTIQSESDSAPSGPDLDTRTVDATSDLSKSSEIRSAMGEETIAGSDEATRTALREVLTSKFVGPSSESSPLLLRCSSTDVEDSIHPTLVEVARQRNAVLISCDLQDFEDLAALYLASEREQAADIERTANHASDSDSDDDYARRPPSLAGSCFGHPVPCGYGNKPELVERSAAAVDSILACVTPSGQRGSGGQGMAHSPDLILHLVNTNSLVVNAEGNKIVKTCRQRAAAYRNARKARTLLVVSIRQGQKPYTPGHWAEGNLRDALKVRADSTLDLAQDALSIHRDDAREVDLGHYKVPDNPRRLARALREKVVGKIANGDPSSFVPHTSSGILVDGGVEAFLSKSVLPDDFVQLVAARLTGRALINGGALTSSDVLAVLEDVESSRQRAGMADGEEEEEITASEKELNAIFQQCDSREKVLFDNLVDPAQLTSTYADVIVDDEIKKTVKQLISLSRTNTNMATSPLLPLLQRIQMNGALFYGPPGTGKTELTRAIAKESGMRMLALDASSLNNKWVGDTEKNISAAFALGEKLHPCILFIDEGDALFRRRKAHDRSWERAAVTTFLQRMDGLTTSDKSPFVIVATNRPSDLDEAFLRRLPQQVHFPLPNKDDRAKILRLWLKADMLEASLDEVVEKLAEQCEGFSGADLKTLCGHAAVAWRIEHADQNEEDGEQPGAVHSRLLSEEHFEKALRMTNPSVSEHAQEEVNSFSKTSSR